jgi:hypothetical protein
MTLDQGLNYFSFVIFGGSIVLIIYIVYYEWKKSQILAEQDEIALGEKENEDAVNNLNDSAIVDAINKDCQSGQPSNPSKPK